jgi:hypothetical protein
MGRNGQGRQFTARTVDRPFAHGISDNQDWVEPGLITVAAESQAAPGVRACRSMEAGSRLGPTRLWVPASEKTLDRDRGDTRCRYRAVGRRE